MAVNNPLLAMKKNILIFAIAALAAITLASCNRKVDFTEIPFVYFNSPSMSVTEDAGVIEIPVIAQANTDFVVTFTTIDGQRKDANTGQMIPNGERGKDYSIVDNDAAILSFHPGTEQQNIKVKITDMTGVLTGNKDFTIKILTAGSEVSVGGFSTCRVTIIDNDHPLKDIFGEYTATDKDGVTWTMTFAADPDSYEQVFVDGIVPTFAGNYVGLELRHYVVAPVTIDPSGQFTVSIPCGYKLADPYDGRDIMIFGYDGTYIYSSGHQTFEQTEDGFVMEGDRGFAAIFEEGGSYYLAASDATVLGPITLKKK